VIQIGCSASAARLLTVPCHETLILASAVTCACPSGASASAARLLTVPCHETLILASAITCAYPVGAIGFVCAFVFAANTNLASFPADGAHFFRVTVTKPSYATAKAE